MIIDSSALIAILKRESEWETLSESLDASNSSKMSAASLLETSIVVDGWRNPVLSREWDDLVDRFSIHIEPVTESQARIARQAYRDYGKGSGHPANLNFGDCFSYALARDKREPLLYKGNDFVHTGLRSA
jgi:ribonuclease VapC